MDAADLHLVLAPRVKETNKFSSGHEAIIIREKCTGCGECLRNCRFGAVKKTAGEAGNGLKFHIDPVFCEGCGGCVRVCPAQAIDFPERVCGQWMISDTRCGPMVHARLGVAAENSGKLVSMVRSQARMLAQETERNPVIIDGPPGIGCPVIASITGASQVLVVTEPTVSGEHDLERVLKLAGHFGVPAAVCVNKWDINPGMAEKIEEKARLAGAGIAGRIRYDPGVTQAQIRKKAVVETDAPSAEDIKNIWDKLGIKG